MLTIMPHALSFGSNYFNQPSLFVAVATQIMNVVILMSIKESNLNTILVIVQSYKIISLSWLSGNRSFNTDTAISGKPR